MSQTTFNLNSIVCIMTNMYPVNMYYNVTYLETQTHKQRKEPTSSTVKSTCSGLWDMSFFASCSGLYSITQADGDGEKPWQVNQIKYIQGHSQTSEQVEASFECQRCELLGGSGGMPSKILKSRGSEMLFLDTPFLKLVLRGAGMAHCGESTRLPQSWPRFVSSPVSFMG